MEESAGGSSGGSSVEVQVFGHLYYYWQGYLQFTSSFYYWTEDATSTKYSMAVGLKPMTRLGQQTHKAALKLANRNSNTKTTEQTNPTQAVLVLYCSKSLINLLIHQCWEINIFSMTWLVVVAFSFSCESIRAYMAHQIFVQTTVCYCSQADFGLGQDLCINQCNYLFK